MSRALEAAKDTITAAPPVYVAAQTLIFGVPLADWASMLAIVYTGLLIFHQVRVNVLPWLHGLIRKPPATPAATVEP
ncbi:hypothetical protein [Pseudomonas oryzihabitans]|uniref:hypothetical protein n=1 Tax=Pseudomonas oryzihabitans TaxID=47885 RepID=UPI0011A60472|nr:hypothetical protein [Pseudomonas oryzihabitans]